MPFESEAQRRWMYANKPEMAKKWEEHTPEGKDLPERSKTSAFWDMLIKLGAVDPTIKSHVARIAQRLGVKPPSARELEEMFPPGWEKTTPSWQEQVQKSRWMREANMAYRGGTGPTASSMRGAAGGVAGGATRVKIPWYSRAARKWIKYPQVATSLGLLGGLGHGLLQMSKFKKELEEKFPDLSEKEFEELYKHIMQTSVQSRSPARKATVIGGSAGGLLGASVPFVGNIPAAKQMGWKNILKKHKAPLALTGLATGLGGSLLGALGGLLATGKAQREFNLDRATQIAKKRGYID